jgi:hypothetical protein
MKTIVCMTLVAVGLTSLSSLGLALNVVDYAGDYDMGLDSSTICLQKEVDTLEFHDAQAILTVTYTTTGKPSPGSENNAASCENSKGEYNAWSVLFDCAPNGLLCNENQSSPNYSNDALLFKNDGFIYYHNGSPRPEIFLKKKIKPPAVKAMGD